MEAADCKRQGQGASWNDWHVLREDYGGGYRAIRIVVQVVYA